ncbi:MAG: molybdopterin-dependent oxidoreductase [Actinomycetota bacterium]|nr:molybdopterin-dependent oxidoreductase [Actinomycetota bacterium]
MSETSREQRPPAGNPASSSDGAPTGNGRPGAVPGPVEHRSFCRLCISLCGILVTTEQERVLSVRGDPGHPLTRGYTCAKGRSLGDAHHDPARLDGPLIDRGDGLEPVSWSTCLGDLAERLNAIVAESGPDSVGMYLATASAFDAAGRRTAEQLLRAIGSASRYTSTTVDTPCKPLVSELMAGHPGLVPALDADRATLVLLLGLNPVVSHGHLNAFPDPVRRLRALARRGEVVVCDPRRTETARLATTHLALRPGSDYALVAHLVRELLRQGADREHLGRHATGVPEFAAAVEPFDIERTASVTGLDRTDIAELVASVRRHGTVAAQTGTGVTMSASANVTEWLVWALHVVTGSYDRPGGMWFNPGFLKSSDRRDFRTSSGEPGPGPRSRPELPRRWNEYPCAAIADEIESGNLRALIVVGGNPLTSLPEAGRLRGALAKLDVLAVADIRHTDTTALATHVLACAGQLERADVPHFVDQFQAAVVSQYTSAVVPIGADRRPMWWCFTDLGRRMGHHVLPGGADPDRTCDDDVIAPLVGRARLSFDQLRASPTAVVADEAVFGWVTERALPGGRWRLAPRALVEQLANLAPPASFVVVPRRQARHLNSQLRDPLGTERTLDEPELLVHPDDAAELGLHQGAPARVRSSSGQVTGIVRVDPGLRRGVVSIPHGFETVNAAELTSGTVGVDPLTGMVLQSGIPVTLEATDGAIAPAPGVD